MSRSDGAVSEFVDEIDPIVFGIGAGITLLFVAVFAASPKTAANAVSKLNQSILSYFNWAFMIVVLGFVIFLFYIMISSWGDVKLGDSSPEYSYLSYFSMMFSAGLAAGVVFWGPVEAIMHYQNIPPLYDVGAKTEAAMPIAMQYSLFHWSISQWSGFTIMGIAIAYFSYVRGAPLRVSAVLTPFVGSDNVDNMWGTIIEILATFATLGGVATSLGFIGSQLITGVEFKWGVQPGDVGVLFVVTGMTVLFTISLVLGVDRGIRRIANFNILVFVVLMLTTLILGPTMFILQLGTQAMGGFIGDFFEMSLFVHVSQNGQWINQWTAFYWVWPLSWSPFIGLFIARISRGRSIREVAFTGIGATALATIPWFIVLGGTGLWMQHSGVKDILGPVNQYGEAVSGYVLFNALPLGELLTIGFILLVTASFITSADSATLAVSMMTTGGKEHPSAVNRIFWGISLGLITAILLVIGGIEALQSAAVITGGPFAIVCVIATIGLIHALGNERGRILLQEETTFVDWSFGQESNQKRPLNSNEDD
jgi:glycine betaine transporter